MPKLTADEILGRRTVKPRIVPHEYQVKHWEAHEVEIEKAKAIHPNLDRDSFMEGWNRAFQEIYGG